MLTHADSGATCVAGELRWSDYVASGILGALMYVQQQEEIERGEQPNAPKEGGGGVTLLRGGASGICRSLESEEAMSSRANFSRLCLAVSGTLPPASGLSSR